jgi:hypothetical protein
MTDSFPYASNGLARVAQEHKASSLYAVCKSVFALPCSDTYTDPLNLVKLPTRVHKAGV